MVADKAHENATVICDVQDLSSFYKDKNFVKLDGKNSKIMNLFCSSHVIEHVKHVNTFTNQLPPINSKGLLMYQQYLII